MSKYSSQQLKEMAMEFLYADGSNDHRSHMLLMNMSVMTKLPIQVIREEIRKLAQYEDDK